MSQVLRERAIGMLTAGMSTRAVARELNVHLSTISCLQRHCREFHSTSMASQAQTMCNHTSPGPPPPASSPPRSSETSHPDSWRCLSVVTLDALTPASVHFLWSSPKRLNRLCWTLFSSLWSSLLLVHIFLPNFFQSTLHLICFDTALIEQSPLSVMTLCDLPSLWRVSMIVFWTIAKSAVFPIIVLSKNKRYPQCILYGWSFIKTQMKTF